MSTYTVEMTYGVTFKVEVDALDSERAIEAAKRKFAGNIQEAREANCTLTDVSARRVR